EIGDLAHELETLFEHLAAVQTAPSAEMYELVQTCHDRLAVMVDQVSQRQPCPPAPELISQILQLGQADTDQPATTTASMPEPEWPAEEAELDAEIGRASCREREESSVVDVYSKKTDKASR